MSIVPLILLAVVFIVCAAVLAAAEAAFTYLPRHEAEELAAHHAGRFLPAILADPMDHMRSLRFWRTLFEMASAIAVALVVFGFLPRLWLAGLIATVIMAVVGFAVVGVSPRHLGRLHLRGTVLATAGLVRSLRVILGPIPAWLERLGQLVAPGATSAEAAFFTEDEFREMVTRATESEMIEDSEAEIIHSVFELGDTKVRAVMVPRTDIISIQAGATLDEAMSLFLRSGCSRVPVFGDSSDEVLGVLYLKDVAAVLHGDAGARPGAHPPVERISREARFVPESKPVADLLHELQRESTHMAIVVDEYGGTAGLVTLEDLIEELVGEIVDEYDLESPEAADQGEGRYLVSSRMSVEDLGDLFGIELDDEEVDSVGGLLAKALGRVPIVGSTATVQGIHLRAERREDRRHRVSHILAWLEPGAHTTPHETRMQNHG